MIFAVNELLQFNSGSEDSRIERILWIEDSNIIMFTVDIEDEGALPIKRNLLEIATDIELGIVVKVSEEPYNGRQLYSEITDKKRAMQEKAWEVIMRIAREENEPAIYERNSRGELVKVAMDEFKLSKNMVYKYLRRYWQRGMNKMALIPDYDKSGGKGKAKSVGEKKRGRPRKYGSENGIGINIDEATKRSFRIAISRHYHTEKANTLITAYEMMIKDFHTGVNNTITDFEELPSFDQFKYWYEKESNFKKRIISRTSEKRYELNNRAVLGKSDADVIGPGSKFQIDATVGDVYLVSRYNRNWIIGRPVIYVVIDVFSRMVVGLYVGLEGPSWLGAMMALANASADKVVYCEENGIAITEEMWPCHYIPQTLLADRGEIESKTAENYIEALNIKIENTPPFRADWKGIVERYFKTIHAKVKPFIPGYIDVDYRQRGGTDYRYDAKLDISQFTQIIIKCILFHNNEHWLSGYTKDELMVEDDVKPIPLELWKFGIANRAGILRAYNEDVVKLSLMPSEEVIVTAKGIKFKKMLYSSETAIKEMWFEKARNKGSWSIKMSYDPRNLDYIYIKTDTQKGYEKCHMLDKSLYGNKTYDEICYLIEHEKYEKKQIEERVIQTKVDLFGDIEEIVKTAEEMTKDDYDYSITKTARVKNIRTNRRQEKWNNRETEAFELDKAGDKKADNLIRLKPTDPNTNEEDDDVKFLLEKQKERLYGKDE